MKKLKKSIRSIDNANFEFIGAMIWLALYIVNSLIIWLMPLFFTVNDNGPPANFYLLNLYIALVVGALGIGTLFFPFLVLSLIWDKIKEWAYRD